MPTGLWKESSVPHKGWTWESVDFNGDGQICEMCDVQEIRHVHFVSHPNYPRVLEVGCVCAENLCEDYIRPRSAERKLRDRKGRWRTFHDPEKWKFSSKGNEYREYSGHHIIIMQRDGGFRGKLDDIFGRRIFSTRTDLLEAMFKIIDPTKIKEN